jgi:hypothetical protein
MLANRLTWLISLSLKDVYRPCYGVMNDLGQTSVRAGPGLDTSVSNETFPGVATCPTKPSPFGRATTDRLAKSEATHPPRRGLLSIYIPNSAFRNPHFMCQTLARQECCGTLTAKPFYLLASEKPSRL